MNINKYKLSVFILASLISLGYYKKNNKYIPNYEICDENLKAYGSYNNGYIYIGNKDYLDELNNLNDDDILIEINDKSMKIYSSYRITDKNIRNEILNVLYDYELNSPDGWNRSIESMEVEWFVHNVLYYCNIKRSSTKDVDFENREENIYNKKLIKLSF